MQPDLWLYIRVAWITVGVIWALAAISAKRTLRVESRGSRTGQIFMFAVAFALLFYPTVRIGPLAWRVIPPSGIPAVVGLAFTIGGIAFAIWARFYLAGNWSAAVAIKRDHALIQTGPYAVIRHPIYAGFLLAMLGTAIELGELGGFFAIILAFGGWLAKARREECFLLAQFGEVYRHYTRKVKMLVPFVL
jgi:protein-S-isoprenylcysteine O-methyltransferase